MSPWVRLLHGRAGTMVESSERRLRVLLLAEMCNPAWTSVPLVGYNFARALAAHPALEVTLVTQIRNRPYLEEDPIRKDAEVCFINTEVLAKPFHLLSKLLRGGNRLAWTIDTALMWPGYVLFEHLARQRFARDLANGRFDLVHRITPVSPTIPSPMAATVRTPFILGPINGGLPWPKEYPELRRREREWLIPLRKLHRLLPYFRSTYKHLDGLITGSRHTATEIPACFRGLHLSMPENGVDPECFTLADRWAEPDGSFRFITVGRLVPLKAVDMIIEAMAASPSLRGCELVVCGEGPERTKLEQLARERGLPGAHFRGWLDQKTLGQELRRAQAFVFPSLKDFGGGAVVEAMAAALPAIVVDYGGPGEVVTDETGIRLPMCRRDELIPRLRSVMEALAGNAERCRTMGAAAVRLVREQYLWSAKADRLVRFYREVLAARRRGTNESSSTSAWGRGWSAQPQGA